MVQAFESTAAFGTNFAQLGNVTQLYLVTFFFSTFVDVDRKNDCIGQQYKINETSQYFMFDKWYDEPAPYLNVNKLCDRKRAIKNFH